MIVKTQHLSGGALIYCLWLVEGGTQHNRNPSMWFFPKRKRAILKGNWKPWENKLQAFELMEDHGLCVWQDSEGWHAGAYGVNDELSCFVDAKTPAMALCLAAITKYLGEHVDLPKEMLPPESEISPVRLVPGMI